MAAKKKELISEEARQRALYRETSYRYTAETEKRHELLFAPYDVSFQVFRTLSYLLLHGGSGMGKTYLLNCVGNFVRAKGVDVLYVTAYDLLMALKNAYFSRTGETAQEYFDAPLLLIDDLGMEPMMETVTVEQIYNLLNARLIRGKYTALSTNLNRVELKQKYTERVSSRLLDPRTGLTIAFLGKDIRLIKA